MDFVPRKRDSRYQWLQNLSDKVIAEAVKFGGAPADATAVKAAADDLIAKMDATDGASAALDGARQTESNAQAADLAAIRAKMRHWKTLQGWAASGSEGVLQARGTETPLDPLTYKPVIEVSIEGGNIRIGFRKLGVDALAIYCRIRGTIPWRKIGIDTESPYFDTAPLAAPGVAEVREYMARGMVGDEEVGLDSDIVSIAFAG